MIRRIAIIPAREGSKRIHDKNIRDFCGKPMIAYVLNAAKDSGLFDVIHVSTDSQRISDVVENLGFPIDFLRSADLADDYTPIIPVLKDVLKTYISRGVIFDQVCLLMATSPLVEATDLRGASELYDRNRGTKPVMCITCYPAPVEWAYRRRADASLMPLQPGMFAIRSQDMEAHYYDSGCFSFLPVQYVLNSEGAGNDMDFIGYILPKYKAVDIDDEEDLILAEAIYRGFHKTEQN
jgi:pseudaminic acid cytidylyltransferase